MARRYAVRVPRVAAAAVGVVLGMAGLLQAVAGRGSALEPLVAVTVAGCGIAVLAIRPARAATDSGFAGLSSSLAGRRTRARWNGGSRTRSVTRDFACCTSWHRACPM